MIDIKFDIKKHDVIIERKITNVSLFVQSLLPFVFSGMLDDYPGAFCAYSVRRLSGSYNGPALRIRRTSDNAELDIGFVLGLVDDATIQGFLGGVDGTVSIRYDQSGNGNDVLITQELAQPYYRSVGYNNMPAVHSVTSAQIFGLAVKKELFKNYTLVAHSALDVVDSGGPTFSLGSTLFGQSGPHNSGFIVTNTDILRSVSATASIPLWNNANDGISHDLLTFKTYNSSRNGTAELKVNYDGNTLTPHSFLADLDASFQYLNSWYVADGFWLGQHQEFIVYENTVSDTDRTGIDTSISEAFPDFAFVLDLAPGASHAYSVRRMKSLYNGYCLRLRRGSDDAEQNIGFDGTLIDDTAAQTFLGGSTGYVSIWYDQSGNGQDITIASYLSQPLYLSIGYNGKPAVNAVTLLQYYGLPAYVQMTRNYTFVAHAALDVLNVSGLAASDSALFGAGGANSMAFNVKGVDFMSHFQGGSGSAGWTAGTHGISHDLYQFKTYNVSRDGGTDLKLNYDNVTRPLSSVNLDNETRFQYLNTWIPSDGLRLGQNQEYIVYPITVDDTIRTAIDQSINDFF